MLPFPPWRQGGPTVRPNANWVWITYALQPFAPQQPSVQPYDFQQPPVQSYAPSSHGANHRPPRNRRGASPPVSRGLRLGYFEAGSTAFFYGGFVHTNLGALLLTPPTQDERSGLGIIYDFQALADPSGMLHHHTVGIELLGSWIIRAGVGLMAFPSFGGGSDDLGFAATIAFGYSLVQRKHFGLSIEVPLMMDVFDGGSSIVGGFICGVQLGFNFF